MNVSVSAPGRICLFGEHQDYFGFPVVAASIDLRATIKCYSRTDRMVRLELLDLGQVFEWNLDELPEPKARQYWLSALHVAREEGWLPERGWNAKVHSQIPQEAGASSSSALTASWCALIATLAGRSIDAESDREWVAHATWRAEVQWFNEPGGMMDQVLCSMGGVRLVRFRPHFETETLPVPRGSWILLNSEEPKDTLGILARAKNKRLELLNEWGVEVGENWPEILPPFSSHWDASDQRLMEATIAIRSVSQRGGNCIADKPSDLPSIGSLLSEHHHWLSHGLGVSTKRIDSMLSLAKSMGAFGGKMNGSGAGGTAFVVVPEERRNALLDSFKQQHYSAIPIKLGAVGVSVERLK